MTKASAKVRDALPCAERGWHDSTVPVCDCGHRWEVRRVSASGETTGYLSKEVRDKFYALYGKPQGFRYEDVIA